VVGQVNALGPEMGSRTDEALRGLSCSFRERLSRGEPLDDLLPEAFAAVREAADRTLGQRPFDVQVMGGAVLHLGKIVEMRTGEGKTLTATLPAYLAALGGAGVHVMTANDYLACRDVEWMGPVYRFLGLLCGWVGPVRPRIDPVPQVAEHPEPAVRRAAYGADVTYGSWEQFDYLRDNLSWQPEECVQRGHNLAIVDEADLILIDEMLTPLLITGPADQAEARHAEFAALAASLERGVHYDIDERGRAVALTEDGTWEVQERLGVGNLYDTENLPLVHQVQTALGANEFYRKDRDYLVTGGEAVIIDEMSGRLQHGRRYADGIHEAIEAKEGLTVHTEQQMLASVPVWDYLGRYRRLAGMTGTASTEAALYRRIYRRDVVQIPTNRPMIRVDHPDGCFRTRQSKLMALIDETATRHATGQPVLIGAASIEDSDEISRLLTGRGITHHVLTARNHEQEAQVIGDAAGLGAVTVVARMAGRGVDIVLGGADGVAHDEVAGRGGLCVLGSERPDSRRLEMHLRGRAGRQGDPGEAKFFVSFEDPLVKQYLAMVPRRMLDRLPDGDPFTTLSRMLDSGQAKATARKAAGLAHALSYDQVLAEQQHLVYAERAAVLRRDGLRDWVRDLVDEVIRAEVDAAVRDRLNAHQLWRGLRELYPISITPQTIDIYGGGKRSKAGSRYLADRVAADAQRAYDRREDELDEQVVRELERRVVLSWLDQAWREHLQSMPDLLNSVAIRSAGGVPALPEYRGEAGLQFARMRDAVKRYIVGTLYYLEIPEAGLARPDRT
jgi:preprotein translocase subunit SecA